MSDEETNARERIQIGSEIFFIYSVAFGVFGVAFLSGAAQLWQYPFSRIAFLLSASGSILTAIGYFQNYKFYKLRYHSLSKHGNTIRHVWSSLFTILFLIPGFAILISSIFGLLVSCGFADRPICLATSLPQEQIESALPIYNLAQFFWDLIDRIR